MGFPGGSSGKESTCQCRRHGFNPNPWVTKIPWRRKWQPTPIFLLKIPWTEDLGGLQSIGSQKCWNNLATKQHTSFYLKDICLSK